MNSITQNKRYCPHEITTKINSVKVYRETKDGHIIGKKEKKCLTDCDKHDIMYVKYGQLCCFTVKHYFPSPYRV